MKPTIEDLATRTDFEQSLEKIRQAVKGKSLDSLFVIDKEIISKYLNNIVDVFDKEEVWEESDACKYLFSCIMARASYDELRLYINILDDDIANGRKPLKQSEECKKDMIKIQKEICDFDKVISRLIEQTRDQLDKRDGKGAGSRAILNAYNLIINGIYQNEVMQIYRSCEIFDVNPALKDMLNGDEAKKLKNFKEDTSILFKGCKNAVEHSNYGNGIPSSTPKESRDYLYEAKTGLKEIFAEKVNESTIRDKYGIDSQGIKSMERKLIEQLFVASKILMYAIREKHNEEFNQSWPYPT